MVITLGVDGAFAVYADQGLRRTAPPIEVVDTVGAGDAFTAGLLSALRSTGRGTRPVLFLWGHGILSMNACDGGGEAMRRFRHLGVAIATAAVISLAVASPAVADGGDTNGYWQYHSTYATYEECDDAGRPFVPSVADGWGCVQYIITDYKPGPKTEDWNLHLVFAS